LNPNIYQIRLAAIDDAPLLPAIERSAGELFRQIPELAWIADDDVQSVERHEEFITNGTAWVAVGEDNTPVGFLNGEVIDRAFHIWETSVHSDHQRQGLGTKLIARAKDYAVAQGLASLTLTTFRGVDWNDVFYNRLGFQWIEQDQLSEALDAILANEASAGLPAKQRCAMTMKLG
jgi:GNAT superfamily N-acetyltransferase